MLSYPSAGRLPRKGVSVPPQSELRDELQRLVLNDLLGPADDPEEIVGEVPVRPRRSAPFVAGSRCRACHLADPKFGDIIGLLNCRFL